MKKNIPEAIKRMRHVCSGTTKEEDINLVHNTLRRWIIRDILKGCTRLSLARARYRKVLKGEYDDIIDSYLDDIEEAVKTKLKDRSYWRL